MGLREGEENEWRRRGDWGKGKMEGVELSDGLVFEEVD